MTVLGSKTVIEMTPEQLKEFAKEIIAQERASNKAKPAEQPMTSKEVAKFLRCHVNTVYKKWSHLRHLADDTPYWFASELEAYLKNK